MPLESTLNDTVRAKIYSVKLKFNGFYFKKQRFKQIIADKIEGY